jgi:lipoprotein NlpI
MIVVFALLTTVLTTASGLDFLSEGEKQLSLNDPAKAVTYLEAALAQGVTSERLFLNLGLAYQKLGQVADAKKTFRQGAELEGPAKKTFLLDLGISDFLSQDWAGAEEAYTAALAVDPLYLEALLNRANTRLSAKDWAGAADDYHSYQKAAPNNPQKDKIDKVLALLDQTVMDAQAVKLAEETRKKKEEADKETAAAAAAAEKQKQDEILARIRESLAGASDDSKNLSTGPSGVKSNDGDFSLEP